MGDSGKHVQKNDVNNIDHVKGTSKDLLSGGFPVVGIGASAGGLSAFESFFFWYAKRY